MINMFKVWISSLLCLGIFVTFLELIMPNSKLRKYIYSLVGVVTIITIISPIINIYKNADVEASLNQVVGTLSSNLNADNSENIKTNYQQTQQKLVKDQFVESIKKDIETKLAAQGVNVQTVDIELAENYDISKIEINILKIDENSTITSTNKVIDYVNQEYDVDYSKITVIESEG